MKTSVFIILFLILAAVPVKAENNANSSDISARVTRLVEKIDQLESSQQQLLADQNAILEEIKNLKIQAHRG